MIIRKKTRTIRLGGVEIGGANPIVVQSMTNTKTSDVTATVAQINCLQDVGCEIVRVAVVDESDAQAISKIQDHIKIPLIADIHFDYRLAVLAMENGADGIRINPGNLGGEKKIEKVVVAAKRFEVPIRVGVNSGSIEKDLLATYGYPTPDNVEALVQSAIRNVHLVEKYGYHEIKISVKSADTLTTINSYEKLAQLTDYPLHLGVTEAGGLIAGTVKSSVALGILLHKGIGDTFRISLTRDPVEEIRVGYELLRSLKIRERGPELISCPTCGRTCIDLFGLAEKVEQYVQTMESTLKVAVMGCAVNGPGEAREADIGVAGGKGVGIIFKKGKIWKKVGEDELLAVFMAELKKMDAEHRKTST